MDFKKRFYSWEEFLEMPTNIQVEYVNWLVNTYDVGYCTISSRVFGKSHATLYQYLKRHGLLDAVSKRGIKPIKADVLHKLISDVENQTPADDMPNTETSVPKGIDITVRGTKVKNINKVFLDTEEFDVELYAMLARAFAGKPVHITLTVEVKDG